MFSAPNPPPKLKDHPLSAIRDWLIQYICSYPPYVEGFSFIHKLKNCNAVMIIDPLKIIEESISQRIS
jgi:hypothetical protein